MTSSDKILVDEFTIIGGNDFILKINMLDSLGMPYELTDCASVMRICEIGDYEVEIDEISGTISSSQISYIIPDTLTSTLSGKYIYQQIVTLADTSKVSPKEGCFLVVAEI